LHPNQDEEGEHHAGGCEPEHQSNEVHRGPGLERPASETVVGALKRLSKTYPMLDKSLMLGATSDLVASHILQGTGVAETIDALEEIFREHYRELGQGCDDTA